MADPPNANLPFGEVSPLGSEASPNADQILAAKLKLIEEEKSMLPLLNDAQRDKLLKKKTCVYWKDFFIYIDAKLVNEMYQEDLQADDPDDKVVRPEHEGLAKLYKVIVDKGDLHPFSYLICRQCFSDKDIPLKQCLWGCGPNSHSNYQKHLNTRHGRIKMEDYKRTVYPSPHSDNSTTVTNSTASLSNTTITVKSNSMKQKEQEQAHIKEALRSMYCFINDCNLSSQTITKKSFRDMVESFRRVGRFATQDQLIVGKQKFAAIRADTIADTVLTIKQLITRTREFYKRVTGNHVPFLCLCSDIWSAILSESLGISIAFCCPLDCITYNIPLGLVKSKSKKAVEVCSDGLQITGRYEIVQQDLHRPVNDNATAAQAAGKLIVNTSVAGTCGMHTGQLVLEHATGLKVRTRNTIPIDPFPAFTNNRKTVQKPAEWILNKKSKGRYPEYNEFVKKVFKQNAIRIAFPNSTRVAGVSITYRDMLRSMHALKAYFRSADCPADLVKLSISELAWKQMAQFTAILKPIHELVIQLQCDTAAAIAVSYVRIGLMYFDFIKMKTNSGFSVVETREGFTPTNLIWGPRAPFHTLPTKTYMYTNQRAEFNTDNFLTADSCLLVDRMVKEMDHYFRKKEDKDRDLAVMCHPLVAVQGLELMVYIDFASKEYVAKFKPALVDAVFEAFKNRSHSGTLPQANPQRAEPASDSGDSDSDDDENGSDAMAAFRQLAKRQKLERREENLPLAQGSVLVENQKIRREVVTQCDEYLLYVANMDWEDLIKQFPTEAYKKFLKDKSSATAKKWKKWIERKDIIHLWTMFDVMQWWNHVGRVKFPMIFVIACISLGKPYTNAAQERSFSLATWFNGRLTQSAKDETFEVRCIDAMNRNNVDRARRSLEEHKSEYQVQKTTFAHRRGALSVFAQPPPVESNQLESLHLYGNVPGQNSDGDDYDVVDMTQDTDGESNDDDEDIEILSAGGEDGDEDMDDGVSGHLPYAMSLLKALEPGTDEAHE